MMTQCGARSLADQRSGFGESGMVGARRIGSLEALGRGLALAAALGTAGCASILNALPDPSSLHLPDKSTFFPTGISSYTRPVSAEGPVGPAELVDGQGRCAGAAVVDPSGVAIGAKGVSLEMSECEVVRTLGTPQSAEIGAQGRERVARLTYATGEHAGIYRFASGRLVSIERGAQPLPPPSTATAKKPSPKKPKPQPTPG
jgi:hypothetical protein